MFTYVISLASQQFLNTFTAVLCSATFNKFQDWISQYLASWIMTTVKSAFKFFTFDCDHHHQPDRYWLLSGNWFENNISTDCQWCWWKNLQVISWFDFLCSTPIHPSPSKCIVSNDLHCYHIFYNHYCISFFVALRFKTCIRSITLS